MPLHRIGISAEFREDDAAAFFVRLIAVVVKIHVPALYLAYALVVPTAGVVYGPRRVYLQDGRDVLLSVELAPAFVEGDPHGYTWAVIQLRDHLAQLLRELRAPALVPSAESAVFVVLHVPARQQRGRDDCRIIAPAAVRHVLPDQHTEFVAVVVPAQGLDLHVLPEHVEAHGLRRLYVEAEGLIARRGIQSVRPPALVQQAVVEIGLAV